MGTTLATKQDLEILRLATKQDLQVLKLDFDVLRKDVDNRIGLLEQQVKAGFARLDQKIDTLDLKLTVKLGSMLFVGFGLTIAAMRLWV